MKNNKKIGRYFISKYIYRVCKFSNCRKFVIVKRKNYEVEDNFREEEIIKIVLNIKEIENMYLSEEKNYVKQMLTINEGWQSISLGDELISETIKVHQDDTWKTMSKEHFQVINMQLKQVSLVTNMIPFTTSLRNAVLAHLIEKF